MKVNTITLTLHLDRKELQELFDQCQAQLRWLVEMDHARNSARGFGMTDDDIAFFGGNIHDAIKGAAMGIPIVKMRRWAHKMPVKVRICEFIFFHTNILDLVIEYL
jgi:hypothetical protein